MQLGYEEPQIKFRKHGIPEDVYAQFGLGYHVCVEFNIKQKKQFNHKPVDEQCERINAKTDLTLQPDDVSHCTAHDGVVDIFFERDYTDESESHTDNRSLSSGVVEMKKPTLVKKQGSQWVGTNLDGDVITESYRTKKALMNEIGADGSKGIGTDENGKVYAVWYEYKTLEGVR